MNNDYNFNQDNDSEDSRAKKILKRIQDKQQQESPKASDYLREIPSKSVRDVLLWIQDHGSDEDKEGLYSHPLYLKGMEAGEALADQRLKSELKALQVIINNMIDLK